MPAEWETWRKRKTVRKRKTSLRMWVHWQDLRRQACCASLLHVNTTFSASWEILWTSCIFIKLTHVLPYIRRDCKNHAKRRTWGRPSTGVFLTCISGLFTDLREQSLDPYGYFSLTYDSISTWQNSALPLMFIRSMARPEKLIGIPIERKSPCSKFNQNQELLQQRLT